MPFRVRPLMIWIRARVALHAGVLGGLLLILSPCTAAARTPADVLRVMTFNVRLPVESDGANRWEARRDLAVRMLRASDADVIGTQELYERQGEDIVARLPRYAWFGEGRRGGDGDEHMGVFYRSDRLRVRASGNFWLSDTPDRVGSITWGNLYPRMVTWASFERIADGARFTLYNTHLPYRDEDAPARLRASELILARLKTLPADEPLVLTGDFNTTPDSDVHALLARMLADARTTAPRRDGPEATFHDFSGKADRRIDWILARGLQPVSVRTITTHDGARYPSDHFPVLAEFAWPLRPAAADAVNRAR